MQANDRLTIAVAQLESRLGDLDHNLRRHLEVIEEVRGRNCDVLMMPETSLVGHAAGPDTLRLARARNDPIIARIAEAAGDMVVIFGMIEEAPAAQFHNAALAVKSGELLFLHHKVNLPTYGLLDEAKYFAPGRYVDTFELMGPWRASLQICADVWNPALVWLAALQGATCLFIPVSSAVEAVGDQFDNPGGWDTTLEFYAKMYGLPIIMANRVGREGDLNFWGGSRILDPFGMELARAGDGEEILTATIVFEDVRRARFLLPTVRDSNLSLVLRETQRLADMIGVPDLVRKA